jgi:hypothetical protein
VGVEDGDGDAALLGGGRGVVVQKRAKHPEGVGGGGVELEINGRFGRFHTRTNTS